MRITILTAGSRGDIQPYVALAKALKASSHHVKIATHLNFKDWVLGHGLDYAQLNGNPRELTERGDASKWVNAGGTLKGYLQTFKEVVVPVLKTMLVDILSAAEDTDLLIPSTLCYYPAYVAAREHNIPWIQSFLQPHHPTSAFPSALIPTRKTYGSFGNKISHYLGGVLLWEALRPAYNDILINELHLAPLRREGIFAEVEQSQIPCLYAYSPAFLPRPSDWPDHLHVTGYWFLDESNQWTPPTALTDFLQAGPPPVYIGFGSMPVDDPQVATRLIVKALEKTKQRAILLKGWGGIGQNLACDNIFVTDDVPHDWLFPQMSAIVHHGGAGTTGAAARAGKPNIVVPFFADQPWWGMRVYERGIGPRPIRFKKLTADNLSQVLNTALNTCTIQERAAQLGRDIQHESGTARAVEIINRYIEHL